MLLPCMSAISLALTLKRRETTLRYILESFNLSNPFSTPTLSCSGSCGAAACPCRVRGGSAHREGRQSIWGYADTDNHAR